MNSRGQSGQHRVYVLKLRDHSIMIMSDNMVMYLLFSFFFVSYSIYFYSKISSFRLCLFICITDKSL